MKSHIKKLTRALSPARISSHYSAKKIIQAFAEDMGLVYFGYAGAADEDEDQRIIRGTTVSVNHRDTHYCVGTYMGYDVTFVERTDHLRLSPDGLAKAHTWHIIEIDLHTKRDLPHVFVGRHSHSEGFYKQLFTKYPALREVRLGSLGEYSKQFLSTFRVYSKPTNMIEVEKVLTPLVTEMVSKHFGNLAIEVAHRSLFIYSEQNRISHALLEAMLKNGIWLANQIDQAEA